MKTGREREEREKDEKRGEYFNLSFLKKNIRLPRWMWLVSIGLLFSMHFLWDHSNSKDNRNILNELSPMREKFENKNIPTFSSRELASEGVRHQGFEVLAGKDIGNTVSQPAGKSQQEIEQTLIAVEWFEKAVNLQKEIEGKENLSELEKVILYYSRAIEINPKYADAYYNRGKAYRRKGDLDQAISDYSQAILLNQKDAEAYNNRGLAYADKGDLDQAISDFNQAILLNPKNAEAYYNKACFYSLIRNKEKALSNLNKAIQLDPEYKNRARRDKGFNNHLRNDEDFKNIVR